jgi:hypothetical protein
VGRRLDHEIEIRRVQNGAVLRVESEGEDSGEEIVYQESLLQKCFHETSDPVLLTALFVLSRSESQGVNSIGDIHPFKA